MTVACNATERLLDSNSDCSAISSVHPHQSKLQSQPRDLVCRLPGISGLPGKIDTLSGSRL